MITINELLKRAKENRIVVQVKTSGLGMDLYINHRYTKESVLGLYDEKYRADLIGWELGEEGKYEPKFATPTLQQEWDTTVEKFLKGWSEWCWKYGCD